MAATDTGVGSGCAERARHQVFCPVVGGVAVSRPQRAGDRARITTLRPECRQRIRRFRGHACHFILVAASLAALAKFDAAMAISSGSLAEKLESHVLYKEGLAHVLHIHLSRERVLSASASSGPASRHRVRQCGSASRASRSCFECEPLGLARGVQNTIRRTSREHTIRTAT